MLSDLAKSLRDTLTIEHQSKAELCDKLHCKERDVRRAAAELRAIGLNVASNSRDNGYWYGTPEEMEIVAKEYDSRAVKCWKTAEAIRKGPDEGQMEVEL